MRILKSESEVTAMCTPADDNLLMVGTSVGSILLFDLQDFESNSYSSIIDELDYEGLLKNVNPASADDGETNF